MGQCFTTLKGIAWILVAKGLYLSDDFGWAHPQLLRDLAAEIDRARLLIEDDPDLDPIAVAYETEDSYTGADDLNLS